MIYILTANSVPMKSIKDYNDNFVFSLLHTENSKIHKAKKTFYQYDIFLQDGMDTEGYDISGDMINCDIHEHPEITSSLDHIVEILLAAEERQAMRDEDLQEEITLMVCCDYQWTQTYVKELNERFAEAESELTALNIYRELHIASKDRLTTMLKTALNTEFIYPDDPIAFGYALVTALGGLL